MSSLKTVIHVHTHYSFDSNLSPGELVAAARREGVGCVAITDHDEIRGALEARRIARDLRIIVGEEVSTREGHVLGLFLEERIPPGLSALETIKRIRGQGGLVLAPHPFVRFCQHSLGRATLRLVDHLDAVEIVNSQNPLFWQDRRAERFARRFGLTMFVGTDGHLTGQFAPAFQLLRDFSGPVDFLAALRDAVRVGGRFGPRYFARAAYQHAYRRITGRPPRGYGACWAAAVA
jgi:predicted metal-dependent phosphoesterase TrpH